MDLRDPRCKQAFERMVAESDVLLDNWGPGALRRLGLGYERLREINPRIIYASLTGYGDPDGPAPGPYSHWPANNPCVQGMGGWMTVTGSPPANTVIKARRWSATTSATRCPASGLPWR